MVEARHMTKQNKMFAALLKFWRGKRGLSQLDLALKADISARHVSFLETGRSQPSQEMVLRLAESLDLSFREQNKMLTEAGFEVLFDEPALAELDDPGISGVLQMMMDKHEPFPMMIMDECYNLLQMNQAARGFVEACLGPIDEPINVLLAIFDESTFKPFIEQWDLAAREVLTRLQREVLQRPNDQRLAKVLDAALDMPGLPKDWREPDLTQGAQSVFPFRFRVGEHRLDFITTVTSFNTPRNVTLEELRIESYFPANAHTEQLCLQLLSSPT